MKALLAISIAAAVVASSAQADVLYNNLAVPSDGSESVSTSGPLADSFSTGASPFSFSALTLLLDATTPSDGGSLTVDLLSDNSTSPGALLDTLGTIKDSSLSTSLTDFALSVSPTIPLSADTRYWIELVGPNSSANWSFSANTSGVGVANEFASDVNGATSNHTASPFQMEIEGTNGPTSVPEPLTLSLLGAGLLGAAAMRRRKAKL